MHRFFKRFYLWVDIMRIPKRSVYLFLIVVVTLSCGPKEDMVLDLQVINRLEREIELISFRTPSSGITQYDTVRIAFGASYEETFFDDIIPDSYPEGMHRLFLSGDSVQVLFNDTLRITHISRFREDLTAEVDSTRLYIDDARSIYNAENFSKTRVNESVFRGVYVIDTLDFEYALRTK